MAGFGASLASLGEKFMNQFLEARVNSEFTEGRALWVQRHDEFTRSLKDEQDYKSIPKNYEKFSAELQKEVLGLASTKRASIGLRNWLIEEAPKRNKQVSLIAVAKEQDYMRASTLKAVDVHIRDGNAPAALAALIRARKAGYFSAEEVERRGQTVARETDWNAGIEALEVDPVSFLEDIKDKGYLESLDAESRLHLKNQAKAVMAQKQREQAAQLKGMREQTMSTMLADVWDGKLTDLQAVTGALRSGYLDDADAKYLRNAIMNPDPPKTTNEALIATRYAIAGIAQGTKSREDALKVLIQYTNQLSPTDGKAFIKEIFGEHDTKNAFWNRQAHEYMEKQIMEVASLTGILYGSGEQLALSAQALMAYEEAKKAAIAKEKPLNGRELLVLAHEVMLPFRKQVKTLMEGEKLPETLRTTMKHDLKFEGLLPPEPDAGMFDRLNRLRPQGRKAPRNNPQFVITDGTPEMAFDAEGKEIGLKLEGGEVLKIGYQYRIGNKVWEYLGNGRAKPIK